MKTIITFIIVFGILVLVHEFGHFFFAKRSGILVREFAIGMGPKLFSHQGKDGTTYTIRILPIGGYVRMAGMGEDEMELARGMTLSVALNEQGEVEKINTSKKIQLTNSLPLELIALDLEKDLFIKGYLNGDERHETTYSVNHDATIIEQDGTEVRIAPLDVQFQSAKLWQRMLTNFAGPMNNFILAFVLFTIYVFMQGGVAYTNTNMIGTVQANSPAEAANLQKNDKILAIDGKKMENWADFTKVIKASPNKELNVTVEKAGVKREVDITPKSQKSGNQTIGIIGVEPPKKTGLGAKLLGGLHETVSNSFQIFKALKSLITGFSLNKLGGPVMMFQLSAQASQAGLGTVIWLMAMLSVNLGIINLLPIPALDGGKILLNIFEGIRGKPLSQEKEGLLTLIGFGFLMLLMVLVTWNDIQRFFF